MKLRMKERALSIAVVVTAAVVIVLAVLQYRWSNEVREATGVRLADTLQLSMINWHLDFLRNFSEVCLTMRVDPERGMNGESSQYLRRVAEWRAIARYPDLISNVYLLQLNDSTHPRALRLNATTGDLEPTQWPSRFELWHEELKQASSKLTPGTGTPTASQQLADSFLAETMRGWRFEPTLPALVHAVAPTPPVPWTPTVERSDWLVIELSDTVIRTKILPDLAQRYFQGTDGLDYQVAVLAGNSPIYSSDAGFGEQEVPDADGVMDIFGRARDAARRSPIRVFHETSQQAGPGVSAGISWFPLLRATPVDEDWQLVVRHRRGGPLGAFVAEMHRRDLAISFGALLLLVISMAMLIVTSNRAQRLARLQMDFVTAVSHELRTPLTVIGSAADNITQGVVDGKEQLKQYGSVIGNQVTQLSGLVEQVLLFAATKERDQRFSLRPLEVSDIIDATLASTAGLIEAAQFTVDRKIEPDLPSVMGDLLALSQCLQNLITNALKYGREQRWIGLKASVGPSGTGGREIQVSVSDRGIGISSADLPHVFEPFYRSASVAAAQIHGTGLGLSLAKKIAEAMHGQLTVTSEPGHGSTFTLHLPCAEPRSREVDVDLSASIAASSQRLRES